jgi:hypothetical protein
MGFGNHMPFAVNIPLRQKWLWSVFVYVLVIALVGGTAWAKLGTTVSSQKMYSVAKKEYQNLLHSKKKIKYRKYWVQAIHRFQSVLEKYPKTQESYKSVFTLGRLYLTKLCLIITGWQRSFPQIG